MKSNAKNEIYKILDIENLQLLQVDCCHKDYYDLNNLPESQREDFKDIYPNAKQYQSLEDLDFEYDTEDFDFLCGTVYCVDNKSKEPVWLIRMCDECTAWWEVSKVPEFYKDKFDIKLWAVKFVKKKIKKTFVYAK